MNKGVLEVCNLKVQSYIHGMRKKEKSNMKKSRFNDAVLMINVENQITVGNNDAIEATVIHQICAYLNKDGSIGADVDYVDIHSVKFLGMPIEEGYTAYREFLAKMTDLGLDVEELIHDMCVGVVTNNDVGQVKSMFSKINQFNS
jgi:hypothetical protein